MMFMIFGNEELKRTQIMGISALSIMLMHIILLNVIHFPGEKVFTFWGNFGVDIFAFLSGMGIFYSVENSRSALEFFQKRIKRVYVPFLTIAIPAYFLLGVSSANDWFLKLSLFQYWFGKNDGTWYVSFIMMMYILSTIVTDNKNKMKILTILFFVVALLELYLCVYDNVLFARYVHVFYALPAYQAGMIFSALKLKYTLITDVKWKNFNYVFSIFFVVSLAFYFIRSKLFEGNLELFIQSYTKLFISIGFIIAENYFLKRLKATGVFNKALEKMGGVSLEIYLIHLFIIDIFAKYNIMHFKSLVNCFLVITLTILLALIDKKILTNLSCFFSKKRRNINI